MPRNKYGIHTKAHSAALVSITSLWLNINYWYQTAFIRTRLMVCWIALLRRGEWSLPNLSVKCVTRWKAEDFSFRDTVLMTMLWIFLVNLPSEIILAFCLHELFLSNLFPAFVVEIEIYFINSSGRRQCHYGTVLWPLFNKSHFPRMCKLHKHA